MNFGEIKTTVLSYMQISDSDFVAALPFLIERTQLRLRSLRVPAKEVRVHGSTPSFPYPVDSEEIKSIWYQTPRNPDTDEYDEDYPETVFDQLIPVSWQQLTKWLQSSGGVQPQYFARQLNDAGVSTLYVYPDAGTYDIEVVYYQRQPVLVNDADSNVYSADYPDLLVYGAVAEGYRWMRSEEKQGIWEAMFQNLYTEIGDAGFNEDYRGGTLQTSSPYYSGNFNRYGY